MHSHLHARQRSLLISLSCALLCLTTGLWAATELRVVTFNTRAAMITKTNETPPGAVAFDAAGRIVAYLDADVYCFQELRNMVGDGEFEVIRAFRDQYLSNYYIAISGLEDGYNYQGIFSRYPILNFGDVVVNVSTISASATEGYTNHFTRELFWAKVDVPGADPFDVFSAHLKANDPVDPLPDPDRRENEARMIRAYLGARWSNEPTMQAVLCGDMNTDADTPAQGKAIDILASIPGFRLTSAPVNPATTSKATYNDNASRFDYQFPGERLLDIAKFVFRSDVGTAPPGVNVNDTVAASDHYPVSYTYELGAPIVTQRQHILLTELNIWDSNNDDEFIELYNSGELAVDLKNWTVTDLDGDDSQSVIASNSAVVLPGDYVLMRRQDGTSDTTSAGDGVLDLYVPDVFNFTTTDDQLVLVNTNSAFVDTTLWNNGDATGTNEVSDFNTLTEYMWMYPSIGSVSAYNMYTLPAGVGGSSVAGGRTLYRTGDKDAYYDTDGTNDWIVAPGAEATPGAHNPGFIPEPAGVLMALAAIAVLRWRTTK
jgi:endonuclease/exonuclease/phosphatase family metal-dependent hydrolase